jgi:hypothetical protein
VREARKAKTKIARHVLMKLAIAALNVTLLAGGPTTSSGAKDGFRPPAALAVHERQFSEFNMTRMEMPWTRNVGLKWSNSSTPRWNVR